MANRKRRSSGNPARTANQRPPVSARSSRASSGASASGSGSGDSDLRRWVSDRSHRPVLVMSRQPKYLIPALILVLVLTGLAAPAPYAVAALVVVLLFVGWLAFLSWPMLDRTQRGMRAFVLAVVVAVAVARAVGAL